MKHVQAPIAAGFLTAIAALGSAPALAGGVPAGTLIENTAQATYETVDGQATISSNTVELAVDEVLSLTLTSLDGGPIGTTPGSSTLTYELTNTGNGPEAFRLFANPAVAGNDFDSTVESIAVDTNGNGVYDPGVDEILTGPEITAELDPDETLTIFVNVTVPDGVADSEESEIELRADAATGTGSPGDLFAGQGVGGGDAIVGSTGATAAASGTLIVGITTVDLTKSQSVLDPFGGTSSVPGSVITYTITAVVSGSGAVSNLVITDAIPEGTTYAESTLVLDGESLTDAADDDAGEAAATGISVDLGTVTGGTTQSLSFDVVID